MYTDAIYMRITNSDTVIPINNYIGSKLKNYTVREALT